MKCEYCGREMKKGKVNLRIGGIGKRGFFLHTIAAFCINNNVICENTDNEVQGWYCPSCEKFIAVFDAETQYGFEEGFDMDLDEEIDSLPQKCCPNCGEDIDIDYPKCPECGYDFGEN